MKTLKYSGFANRVITSEDFANVGVKGKGLNVKTGEVIEVNDQVAKWLLENEGADFAESSEAVTVACEDDDDNPEAAAGDG